METRVLTGNRNVQSGYLYCLVDPRSPGDWRYVGESQDVDKRVREHIYAARRGNRDPVYRWIRKLLAAGISPSAVTIQKIRNSDDAIGAMSERAAISAALESGHRLLNVIDGGAPKKLQSTGRRNSWRRASWAEAAAARVSLADRP